LVSSSMAAEVRRDPMGVSSGARFKILRKTETQGCRGLYRMDFMQKGKRKPNENAINLDRIRSRAREEIPGRG
jgi:hypothetical protein